jgi:hypothetical protein
MELGNMTIALEQREALRSSCREGIAVFSEEVTPTTYLRRTWRKRLDENS